MPRTITRSWKVWTPGDTRVARQNAEGKLTYEATDQEKQLTFEDRGFAWDTGLDCVENWRYNPPARSRIPQTGGWAMLIRKPMFGPPLQDRLKVGMVFWARHEENCDEFGFNQRGEYAVIIQSPWAEFKLFPWEYSVMDTASLFGMWQNKEMAFRPHIGITIFSDALFYVQSRGIGLEEALPMVLGTITGNVGWFRPRADLQKIINQTFRYSTGLPILDEENHRRRAASRKGDL